MDITGIRYVKAGPYMTKAEIAEAFGISIRTVCNRLSELAIYIAKGRYSEYTILDGFGVTYVNYLALVDFMRYRKELKAGRRVPPFNPKKVAEGGTVLRDAQ